MLIKLPFPAVSVIFSKLTHTGPEQIAGRSALSTFVKQRGTNRLTDGHRGFAFPFSLLSNRHSSAITHFCADIPADAPVTLAVFFIAFLDGCRDISPAVDGVFSSRPGEHIFHTFPSTSFNSDSKSASFFPCTA